MGFKMKGSAFKLGNVATKSALKQTTAGKTVEELTGKTKKPITKSTLGGMKKSEKPKGPAVDPDPTHKEPGGPKMKSPLEQDTLISPITNKPYPSWVMNKPEGYEQNLAIERYDFNQELLLDPQKQKFKEHEMFEDHEDVD